MGFKFEYDDEPLWNAGLSCCGENAAFYEFNNNLEEMILRDAYNDGILGSYSTWRTLANPFTILDPASIPLPPDPDPELADEDYRRVFADYYADLAARFGSDGVETLAYYVGSNPNQGELFPPGEPFTFCGSWTEVGAGSAPFGYFPRHQEPAIVVAFC